jgi:beta-xylosidase
MKENEGILWDFEGFLRKMRGFKDFLGRHGLTQTLFMAWPSLTGDTKFFRR